MFKDKTIVYTSGTFDMFHYNHLRMINYARSLADILIVGVSTDELVSSYKAKPIIPFTERLQIIEALKTPDIVIPQHTLDHSEIVKKLNIDASLYTLLQVLSLTLFEKMPLQQAFPGDDYTSDNGSISNQLNLFVI